MKAHEATALCKRLHKVTTLPDGVVFLPAAGFRRGSDVSLVGSSSYYWSSTAYNGSLAYLMPFGSSIVGPDGRDDRSRGFSVRLITESK